jgi:hypothetical protein
MLTGGTNRHLLQPTKANERRRKSKIKDIQASVDKGKNRSDSSSGEPSSSKTAVRKLLRQKSSSSSSSGKTDKSQLVDLVVEDHDAEDVERVRARKEGGSGWNEVEPKHYV